MAKTETRSHSTGKRIANTSDDRARVARALRSAEGRLRRTGKRRENRETQAAYRTAADMIHKLIAK